MLITTSEIIPKSAKGKPGPIRSKAIITVFDTTTGIRYRLWAVGEFETKNPTSSRSTSEVSLTISSIHSSIQYLPAEKTEEPREMKPREFEYTGSEAAGAWAQLGDIYTGDVKFQAAIHEGKRFIAEHCPGTTPSL